jgi:hypothetical protein
MRYLKAFLTLIIKASVFPHELGHFYCRRFCGMPAESLTIGNPEIEPIFKIGWFHIGELSTKFGGGVLPAIYDRSMYATWKRVLIPFAGPFMDICLLSLTVYLYSIAMNHFTLSLIFCVKMLILLWLFAISISQSLLNMRAIKNGDNEYDGWKIKDASKAAWITCLIIVWMGIVLNFYWVVHILLLFALELYKV